MPRHRRTSRVVRVVAVASLAATVFGCSGGPPTEYTVSGRHEEINMGDFDVHDAFAWRQPTGDVTYLLFADNVLPKLPADDAYALLDLDLLAGWTDMRVIELDVDADGKLLGKYVRGDGASRARCEFNPGQCYSAVDYLGDDAITASYEFGDDIDVTLAQPIHRLTRFQTPLGVEQRIGPDGNPAQPVDGDHDAMAERYLAVRRALDGAGPRAFLEANGNSGPLLDAMVGAAGIGAAVTKFASTCPQATSFEPFGNDGAFGSLFANHGDGHTVVYFLRRGETWVLHSCGSR
jgi:hypothetical protein